MDSWDSQVTVHILLTALQDLPSSTYWVHRIWVVKKSYSLSCHESSISPAAVEQQTVTSNMLCPSLSQHTQILKGHLPYNKAAKGEEVQTGKCQMCPGGRNVNCPPEKMGIKSKASSFPLATA